MYMIANCLKYSPGRTRVGNGDGVRERDIPNLDVLVAPLVEQLHAANLVCDVLGEDRIASGAIDFDFAVRHNCDFSEGRLVPEWRVRAWVVVDRWKFVEFLSVSICLSLALRCGRQAANKRANHCPPHLHPAQLSSTINEINSSIN